MIKNCCLWLLLGLSIVGCSTSAKTVHPRELTNDPIVTVTPRAVPVDVFEVAPPSQDRLQPVPAVILVEGMAMVLAKRDGVVVALNSQEGALVKQGEVLMGLDNDEARAQLRHSELEVSRLQFEERQYEGMIKVNRSELARQQTLARDGLASQTEIERAQYRLEVSEQELEKTRLGTRMALERRETARLEVEKTVIRAPLSGIITQQFAKLGSSVVRNDKLFEIAQSGPLSVRFQLAPSDAWQPKVGESIRLSLNVDERGTVSARIQRLAPVADAASNARGYFATVLGGTKLIPGAAVFVERPRSEVRSVYWIPRAAFPASADLKRGSSAVLLVVEGDKSIARTVWLGSVVGDQVEVSAGITPGEKVILAPGVELKPGDGVTVNRYP